jgi:hypothetical protein
METMSGLTQGWSASQPDATRPTVFVRPDKNSLIIIDITRTRQFPRLHAGIFLASCAEIS